MRTEEELNAILLKPEYWYDKGSFLFNIAKVALDNIASGKFPQIRVIGWDEAAKIGGQSQHDSWNVKLTSWMLIGMAVECWLKGLVIHKETPAKFNLSTHKLAILAKRAGLNLTDDDERILDTMEALIVGFGRYPAPKDPKHSLLLSESDFDITNYETLGKKILARYDELEDPLAHLRP